MQIEIDWNKLSLPAWEERFARIKRAPVLQSYEYAQSICPIDHQKARWGLIRINNQEAGLVQIQEAKFLGTLFHAVILDRGPLWFESFGGAAHIDAFFAEFNRQFPRRFGRKRRIIPEIPDGMAARTLIEKNGFSRLERPGYSTIWIDLQQNKEVLLGNLAGKWRNMMRKAEKLVTAGDITIKWDNTAAHIPWMLETYEQDKLQKGYDGPSLKLLRHMAIHFSATDNILLGRAFADKTEEAIAFVFFLCHGRSATYQIGWNSKEGRDKAVHNMLLWDALSVLKDKGIDDLDLGGINDESAKNVKKFKEGMGGEVITLLGHYN